MPFVAQLKKDIDFYKNLSSLLKVLKGIAISQFHVFERKAGIFEPFSKCIDGYLSGIDLRGINHPFLRPTTASLGVVAITSDVGLLGGLNMHVMNAALSELEEHPGKLTVVGERGKLYAQEKGIPCTAFGGVTEENRYVQSIALRNHLIKEVLENEIGVVQVIYPHAYSLVTQRILRVYLFPYGVREKGSGHYFDLSDFVLESSIERIAEYLVFLWLGKRIYEIFNISKLAEFAARFMHLEECGHNIEEKDEKLKLKYFRMRHELTDRGMRELFAARLMSK